MKIIKLMLALACFALMTTTGFAQQKIEGQITAGDTQASLEGAAVQSLDQSAETVTDANGHFQLNPKTEIDSLKISYIGYVTKKAAVKSVFMNIMLSPSETNLNEVVVTALPPSLQPTSTLSPDRITESNVRDAGELLRNLQGVDAVRRGPIGLDPSIRGLRESEVGFYVNGSREFSAGPARMDSPLNHYDPDDIKSIEVVKGPYALTWGPGNLSAVRMKLKGVPNRGQTGILHGKVGTSYNTNLNSLTTSASLFGRKGNFGYRIDGNYRDGSDYKSGDGTEIPANFRARELRGTVEYDFNPLSTLTLNGGLQYQNDINDPGRLLDAHYFHSFDGNADYVLKRPGKLLRKIEVQGYFNRIAHQMDNNSKPTAKADSTRMPPFPLHILLDAESQTYGGKVAFNLVPSEKWHTEMGGDFFSNDRKAVRHIDRGDTGMHLFTDLAWPEANVTMGGLYAYAKHNSGIYSISGTVRGDAISSLADTISQFFAENVSDNLDEDHFVMSGALTFSAKPSRHWNLSAGVGTVARAADASELYSDRFPASKAQTSAEFVGNPQLKPERSYQADIWANAIYSKFSLSANLFARRLHNYITIVPTDLPKNLPLSPSTVYAYRNGKADFYGFEFSGSYKIMEQLILSQGASYLWGEDLTQDEPVLGISPFRTDTRLRYQIDRHNFFAEGSFHTSATQDRVAASRGETPTSGYYTLGLKTGISLSQGFSLQVGVDNLTDVQYVNHLNSKNPYTKMPIPEPGRVFYAKARFRF